jgi:hypothetical protein
MIPLFVLPFTLLVVLASSRATHARTLLPAALASVQFVFVLVRVRVRVLPAAINTFVKSLHCADHHPIRIGDERERLVTASPVMTIAGTPAGENNYPENGLVKPPRRVTRALSPAGMFGGKALLRLAASKSRAHAPSVPMRGTPACFFLQIGGVN